MGFLMDTHDSNVKKMLNTFQITHKKQSMQVDSHSEISREKGGKSNKIRSISITTLLTIQKYKHS